MMIINDMMIIDEVRNKNKIIKATNLRPSSISWPSYDESYDTN